uniref:Uncharacterized protein n=1 Tax=Tanacetum cinerariifolium TaxID=118510 RepID=A0A699H0P5_TANCI|nr:hypothetical protein [Tanacetum cinerariifolium]
MTIPLEFSILGCTLPSMMVIALGAQSSTQQKLKLRPTKDFEAKYNKVKAKLALLGSSASTSKSLQVRNQGLFAEAYEWDEEKVSSDDNEMVEVKVRMALVDDERDNDERKTFHNYLGVDLNFVEEQRNNLMIKHRDIVQELNTCKEKLLELKQAKLDFLTMQHVNTKILKKNQNLIKELKELTAITKTWLNSSNNVNQCISEQIPNQKKRILGVDQLPKYPSSSRKTDLVFIKSSADNTNLSIPNIERLWLSEAEGFNFPNHNTSRILSFESQVKVTDLSVNVTDSSVTDYDSAEESSSVCSTPLLCH